jgi:DNA-binding IclR family transcriptional regulator
MIGGHDMEETRELSLEQLSQEEVGIKTQHTKTKEVTMVTLNDIQKSQLRKKYERLGAHQGGIGDSTYRQLKTEEILRIFAENQANPQKWPTLTDLESYLRTIATLKSYGVPVKI